MELSLTESLVIFAVLLLIFGTRQLAGLVRNLRQSVKELQDGFDSRFMGSDKKPELAREPVITDGNNEENS